ncbi:MAG: insulinase family protein [Bdellovibrionales bacterium]|nr:insulinase family protein [Bdellovibrionales bacterium]
MTSTAFDFQPEFFKTTLSNGVRVVTEHHPYTRAVSAAIYVTTGARDEPEELQGMSHFIEHMVFKGTKNRSQLDIVKEIEAVGGEINAYTTKEYTCFHTTTLREHLGLSMDVLADLVTHAQFDIADLEKEKSVVQQEIDMCAEQFEEFIFDEFFEQAYKGHSLSHNILGTTETLKNLDQSNVLDYYKNVYGGQNMIVAVSGCVNHKDVVDIVERIFGPQKKHKEIIRKQPSFNTFKKFIPKTTEQMHLLFGFPVSSFKDQYRFESFIVNALLGGGMTSRLYQNIREEKGWVYSVYSYLHNFTDAGLMMFYAATTKDLYQTVYDEMLKEIYKVKDNGITKEELESFKMQVKGQILLGADDIENRMNSIAVNEMVFQTYRPVEDTIASIEAVSVESIHQFLETYFKPDKMGLNLLGLQDPDEVQAWFNKI